jgi:uncharacterized protein YndB with AHSA1/START domain
MTAVEASIVLPASPDRVWAVVMDPHQFERWVTIHRGLTSADDGPPRVGFEMAQRYSIRGAPVSVSWRLEALDPPYSATWTGKGPAGAKALIEYRLQDIDGGTRFHYTNDFSAPLGALGRVASKALMGGVPDREAHASLERLRLLLAQE